MKRWHEDSSLCWRRAWQYARWLVAWNCEQLEIPTKFGRYRKRKPLDCGKTQCKLCHSDKFPKRYTTYREWEADLKFREGLADL